MEQTTGFIHPDLLDVVQMQQVFPDGKTFVDCQPLFAPDEIDRRYAEQRALANFNLKTFIREHFKAPVPHSANFQSNPDATVEENINRLWEMLTRQPDEAGGSLIPLPYPYIVPGGRFGEIYYWDSYFTMLGLKASGQHTMIRHMVDNFSFLIDSIGYIPNGNRRYFLGRSQPPFYSLMVRLLAAVDTAATMEQYLPQLLSEYAFWMRGKDELGQPGDSAHRVAMLSSNVCLNRYWDENTSPRPESYREDVELAEHAAEKESLYRHLRAGAESGWDFSCRWFADPADFSTIHTTDIIPVDLNCLLHHLESTLASIYRQQGDAGPAETYETLAQDRKAAILHYCWNEAEGFFMDYDLRTQRQTTIASLAGVFPLAIGIASPGQAAKVATRIRDQFLKPGGVVTTLKTTGQQWDAPNGWAPLQWMTVTGLEQYGAHKLAQEIAKRWVRLNRDVFRRTGKLMEKYNVVDTDLEAGGGEYPGQDGFGWTNGVFLALLERYPELKA